MQEAFETVSVFVCCRCGFTGTKKDFENPMKGSGNSEVKCSRCTEAGWGGIKEITFIKLGNEWLPIQ